MTCLSAPRLTLFFVTLALGACVAVAEVAVPPRPVPYAEPTPATEPGPESEPSDEVIGPRFGGNGGTPARVRCPGVNGLQGQSGNLIDRSGLICFMEDQVWDSPAYGGTGGNRFQKLCPPGARAVGVVGRSGELVDALGLRCSDSSGQLSLTDVQGGGGGTAFEWLCPAGLALIGLDLMVGMYVDSVAPVCARR